MSKRRKVEDVAMPKRRVSKEKFNAGEISPIKVQSDCEKQATEVEIGVAAGSKNGTTVLRRPVQSVLEITDDTEKLYPLKYSRRMPQSGPFQISPGISVKKRVGQETLVWAGPFNVRKSLGEVEHKIICYSFDHKQKHDYPLVRLRGMFLERVEISCALSPTKWLCDTLINMWTLMLQERQRALKDSPCFWYFPVDLERTARVGPEVALDYALRLKWVDVGRKRLNAMKLKEVFVPVNVVGTGHFYLVVFNLTKKYVDVWDSLGGSSNSAGKYQEVLDNLCTALDCIIKPEGFRFSKFDRKASRVSQQPNGCDCGLFVCYWMGKPDNYDKHITSTWRSHEKRCKLAVNLLATEQNESLRELKELAIAWHRSMVDEIVRPGRVGGKKSQAMEIALSESFPRVLIDGNPTNVKKVCVGGVGKKPSDLKQNSDLALSSEGKKEKEAQTT